MVYDVLTLNQQMRVPYVLTLFGNLCIDLFQIIKMIEKGTNESSDIAKGRDDFTPATKRALADRVAWRCSCPGCGQLTVGPSHENEEKTTIVGEAAHITAASKGGPRYDPHLTSEDRKSISNGIWMCRHHARLIDSDYMVRLNTSLTFSQVFHRLNTSFTILKIQTSKSRDASMIALWQNQTNRTRKRNRNASMRSIDIRWVNAPPKFAKALADQGCGCESGLEDTTIPIKTAKRSGIGMNPEHRRMFIEKQIRRWNNS